VNNKSPATGIGGQQTRAPVTSGGPDNAMPRLGVKGLGTEPK
jgi:hypothetical protein